MANWAKLQEDTIQLPVFKRARHGIHFQNTDGSITANFSGKPCHFQDTDGLWKPIDTKLLPLGDGYYGCPHSKVKVHPDGTVAVTGTDYVQRVELPSAQTGLVDGDKLVRKFSFGEQRMWVTEDGFKSEIQLNRIPTLTEARKLIATESSTLSKEYLKSLTTATDANGNSHTFSTLTAFRTWLASAVFPVVIDPDFAGKTSEGEGGYAYGSSTDYATARSTSAGGAIIPGNEVTVGQRLLSTTYTVYRIFVSFDTSSIDDSATIDQVNLKFTNKWAVTVAYDIYINKDNFSSNRETAYDGALTATRDSANWRSAENVLSSNTQYTSGDLSTSWVNKTGNTKYSLIMSSDVDAIAPTGNTSYILYFTTHATESYRPVLTVTYTAGGGITPIVQYYNQLRRNK